MATDLLNKRFGRWTVKRYSHKNGPHYFWFCRCKCGNERTLQQGSLVSGRSVSCGCYRQEVSKRTFRTHGKSQSKLHGVWVRMRQRCENPKAVNFKFYGGRGITVCAKWQTFEGFYEDMGSGWKEGLTIERIDNDGGYKKSNCKWATKQEQATNRRSTVFVETKWGLISVSELARRIGANRRTLAYRISKFGNG